MDGLTFHERLNILLHNRGDEYVVPNPFWKPEDLTRTARAALDTVYTALIGYSRTVKKPVECLNQMIKSTAATSGTNVPSDFYEIIVGQKANGHYVNADPLPIAAASASYDSVWTSAGKFRGTAATAWYYARPSGPCAPSDVDITLFPDGFYDAVITLTALETICGDEQDVADRYELLVTLFQEQLASFGIPQSAASFIARVSKEGPTTKGKRLSQLRESDTSLGSWNPDATASDRPMGDFSEVFNMRKMKPGELEVRSGYKRWLLDKPAPVNYPAKIRNPPGTPLWKAEYRIDSTFVDVTFFIGLVDDGDPTDVHAWHVYAYILHPELNDYPFPDPDLYQIVDIGECGFDPKVCAYQFQTYLVVSIVAPDLASVELDTQMFALWATDIPTTFSSGLTSWTLRSLGKQVSPAPIQSLAFADGIADKVAGKLLAFIPEVTADHSVPGLAANSHQLISVQKDPLTGENLTATLDIQVPYVLSNHGPFLNFVEPLWTKNKQDPNSSAAVSSPLHIKSRGWWYRAVLKKKYLDARGQTHIISEAPSADWYVEEANYVPPVLSDSRTNTAAYGVLQLEANPPNIVANDTPNRMKVPVELGDWAALRAAFSNQFGSVPEPSSPLYYVAAALGKAGNHNDFVVLFGQPDNDRTQPIFPYKLAAGAHEINGAPNVKYSWVKFGLDPTTDPTLYAVDLYRTAYSYPDEKTNATKSPLWGTPYNYGYVGTLHAADTDFLDNIADTLLLFDQTPITADGFLENQFAGEVMRPYQDHLVLGNIREKARVRNPWSEIQVVISDASDGYVQADFAPVPQDGGRIKNEFFYAYQDRDGHISDAVQLNISVPTIATFAHVAFLFPRGYSDTIVSAILYRAIYDAGTRTLYKETVVSLSGGVYVSSKPTLTDAVSPQPAFQSALYPPSYGTHDVVTSVDPGYILWSKKNNPWEWPQENILNVHDQNPITGMDEVIGPLYVWSDRGVSMTRTDSSGNEFGYLEPVHTSSTGVGCLSRFAIVKVDQVVFHVGAGGLFYTGGSGVVPFPANIQIEVTKRLRELFSNQPTLHGVRERVSLSWNANRKELILSFPSTIEVAGTLPAKTFVIKFIDKNIYAYEFELAHEPGEMQSTPTGRIIYLPHADGSLFSAYYLPGGTKPDQTVVLPKLVVQDNDRQELPWPGQWAFQYQHAMGTPNISKRFYQFNFLAEAKCQFFLKSGVQREDNLSDHVNGTLDPTTPVREVRAINAGALSEYRLPISGSVLETSGTPPGVRLIGQPNADTLENQFKIESFDLFFSPLHQHRG